MCIYGIFYVSFTYNRKNNLDNKEFLAILALRSIFC